MTDPDNIDIDYHDMTPAQQRIADTAENGLIGFLEMPLGLTRSEMLVWMRTNVARKPADLDHVRLTDGRVGLILGVRANGAAFEVEFPGDSPPVTIEAQQIAHVVDI
jgi:hypothetical protein